MKRILFIISYWAMCGDLHSRAVDAALGDLMECVPSRVTKNRLYFGGRVCIDIGPEPGSIAILEQRGLKWVNAYGNKIPTGGVAWTIYHRARKQIDERHKNNFQALIKEAVTKRGR